MNEKISVHVISYNQFGLIGETLRSLVEQDYDNLEIVVGDDASTDGTASVIRDFEAAYPGRVLGVFSEVNGGITANSNRVLARCTGDLIATIGGDDIFLPGKISRQAEVFRNPNVSMSYHPVEVFESATGKTLYHMGLSEQESPRDGADIIAKFGIPASSLMFRRSAFPGIAYDTRLNFASDWLLSIEMGLSGRIERIPDIMARYRKHSNNVGNRISAYEGDFLRTLEIVEAKYGTREDVRDACRLGRARYLFGYAFRVGVLDAGAARSAVAEATRLDPQNWRYRLGRSIFAIPGAPHIMGRYRRKLRSAIGRKTM